MPKAPLYSKNGERIGEIDLNESIFGCQVREALLHSAVCMQRANQRQGTVATKTRSAVRGGGRKPWRQKGTGRARQGTIRSPLWPGGGTVFGPHQRDYSYKIPKSARPVALKSALSARAEAEDIAVIEAVEMGEPKTQVLAGLLQKVTERTKTLLVLGVRDINVEKSARNIQGVRVMGPEGLNVYDVLNYDRLLFTRSALERVEEVLL